jgi:hypothetical protein
VALGIDGPGQRGRDESWCGGETFTPGDANGRSRFGSNRGARRVNARLRANCVPVVALPGLVRHRQRSNSLGQGQRFRRMDGSGDGQGQDSEGDGGQAAQHSLQHEPLVTARQGALSGVRRVRRCSTTAAARGAATNRPPGRADRQSGRCVLVGGHHACSYCVRRCCATGRHHGRGPEVCRRIGLARHPRTTSVPGPSGPPTPVKPGVPASGRRPAGCRRVSRRSRRSARRDRSASR